MRPSRAADVGLVLSFAVVVLLLWSIPDTELPGGRGDGAPALVELSGVRLATGVLGATELTLEAASARPRAPRYGPFSIGGAHDGLELQSVRATLGDRVSLRADRAVIDGATLELSGPVRLDAGDRGLLFASHVRLSIESDRIDVPGVAVLHPEGDAGAGGRSVVDWSGTLAELLRE